MSGFLTIDKPSRMTSRDVTSRIFQSFRPAKVGHVGTLDPLATGVLVIAVGDATRLSDRLHAFPKEYVAQFRLGCESDTQDITGTVTERSDRVCDIEAIRAVAHEFVGTTQQTPPAYSAAKVGGQRAYDLARAGRQVDLAPRTIDVAELEVLDPQPATTPADENPSFRLRVVCRSGTYVRTLGVDLAARADASCVLTQLRRTRVGPFTAENAISPDEVNETTALTPCRIVVGSLPQYTLGDDELRRVLHGNALPVDIGEPQVALMTKTGNLLALAEQTPGGLQPRTVLKSQAPL